MIEKMPPYLQPLAIIQPLEYDQSLSYYEFLNKLYQYVKDEIIPTVNQMGEIANELAPLVPKIPVMEENITNLQNSLESVNLEIREINFNIESMSEAISTAATDIDNIETEITNILSSITSITTEISSIQTDIEDLQLTVGAHTTEIADLTDRVEDLEEAIIHPITKEWEEIDQNIFSGSTITINSQIPLQDLLKHKYRLIIKFDADAQAGNSIHQMQFTSVTDPSISTTFNVGKFAQLPTFSDKFITVDFDFMTYISGSITYAYHRTGFTSSYTQFYDGVSDFVVFEEDMNKLLKIVYTLTGTTNPSGEWHLFECNV